MGEKARRAYADGWSVGYMRGWEDAYAVGERRGWIQGRAAPLALRELAHRQLRHVELSQCGAQRLGARGSSGEPAADREVLVRRQLVFHRGRMPDVDELARVVLLQRSDRLAFPAHRAGAGRGEPAQDPQQAGLAAAVGAGDAQQLARRHGERDAAKELAPAALAFQLLSLQHAAIVS